MLWVVDHWREPQSGLHTVTVGWGEQFVTRSAATLLGAVLRGLRDVTLYRLAGRTA